MLDHRLTTDSTFTPTARTLTRILDAFYFGWDAFAPGSSASLKISVVSSLQLLIPVLQLTEIVFFAITSESRTAVQPPIS